MGKYRIPILKCDMVEAILYYRPELKKTWTIERIKTFNDTTWNRAIRKTAWMLFTYRHDNTDRYYNLIRRAALQIDKNGAIKWGRPRTKAEYERENIYY